MLNEIQKKSFNDEAVELSQVKKQEGYMSYDLVALGYYLIKNNIAQAEEMEKSLEGLDALMKQVEELLGDKSE